MSGELDGCICWSVVGGMGSGRVLEAYAWWCGDLKGFGMIFWLVGLLLVGLCGQMVLGSFKLCVRQLYTDIWWGVTEGSSNTPILEVTVTIELELLDWQRYRYCIVTSRYKLTRICHFLQLECILFPLVSIAFDS